MWIIIFFPLLCFAQWLSGSITSISSIAPFIAILESAKTDDLIVVDVDNTLLIAQDRILRPCGENYFLEQFGRYAAQMNEARVKFLSSAILLGRKISLTEEEWPELIKNLLKNGVKVIAISSLLTGSHGSIKSMEDWREKELQSFNLDFSPSFPRYNHIIFGDIRKQDSLPIFKQGVLYCAKHSKGEILEQFLRRVKWEPKRVIALDDLRKHLESIEASMRDLKIDCLAFHYQKAECAEDKLDEALALKQLQHLLLHEEWLSENELK